ncbi:MAG: AAA family ATPase [Gammaproteobacteria bacterium]|nr:AAA family ATPase [Gammaproteobacteria bacterium]
MKESKKDKEGKTTPVPSDKIKRKPNSKREPAPKAKRKGNGKSKAKRKGNGKSKGKSKGNDKAKVKGNGKSKRQIKDSSDSDSGSDAETLVSESMSEDDSAESDIDEHGNIIGLIDYEFDNATHARLPRRPKRTRLSHRRARVPLTRSKSIDIELEKPAEESMDNAMAKMIILSQLCSHVDNMGGRRGRKKKKRCAVDTSDEDSDMSYDGEDEEEDIRDTFTPAEAKYYKKLGKKQRRDCVEEYESLQQHNKTSIPLKFRIMTLQTSVHSKAFLMNRLNSFQNMEPNENEYHKLSAWFSQFNKIPIGVFSKFPLNTKTSTSKDIYKFLASSRTTLNDAVYGHDNVKDEIIQLISSWISNESGSGQVLALQGPPGNGKTTLVKNGLSKVLGRPFVLIALGGAKDSAFLQGHEYTFEGSKPGRIAEVLRNAGCMNPVIFFDEVDKLSESPAGKEISNLLCHLLDPVQNSTFKDRYFAGIDLDLSKAVFVMSFNDVTKIDPVMKDRMKIIRMHGFKPSDKVKIAQHYLLPEICKEFNFKPNDLIISPDIVNYIVTKYTSELGVRDLRRKLSTIMGKLNVLKLMGKRTLSRIEKVVNYKLTNKIKFPLTLTEEYTDQLLKDNINRMTSVPSMYL